MAESRRKLDSKKYQKDEEVDEKAVNRRHRIWQIVFLIGGIAIVAAMFFIATFLSGKK